MERLNEHRTTHEYRAHCEEIARLVELWQRGEITVSAKRASIALENQQYYGTTGTKLTEEPQLTDEVAHVLAAGSGQSVSEVSGKLNARRLASQRDANRGPEGKPRRRWPRLKQAS
jgi:hypothetical protein